MDSGKKNRREKAQLCGTSEWSSVHPQLASGQAKRAEERGKEGFGHGMGLKKSEEARTQRICSVVVQKGKLSLMDYV